MTLNAGLFALLFGVVVGSASAQNDQGGYTLPPGMTIWDLCVAPDILSAGYYKCYDEGEQYLLIHGQSAQSQCRSFEILTECMVKLGMTCPVIYRSYYQQFSPYTALFQSMCNRKLGLISIEEFEAKFWDFVQMKWLEHVARLNGETTSVPTLELMMTTSSLADEGDVMRTTAASILEMSGKKVEELLLTSEAPDVDAMTNAAEIVNKDTGNPALKGVTKVPNKKTLAEILTTARSNDTPKEK